MTQKLGEGTFSEVLKVKHKTNGKIYAMKRFRKRFNSTFEEIQNLREIQALRRLNPHTHVIQLIEVIFDQKHGVLALNFELMDCNLYELISRKNTVMTENRAKNYFYQICKGIDYMHRLVLFDVSKGIFHRDIKPENILIKENTIKLADFGSCRGIHSKQPYTEYIATRWYRSPECLLCDGIYTFKMDLWGAGCVLYEIITKAPLFPGSNELDQLHRIHGVVGTPSQKLLKKMLGPKGIAPEYNFTPKEGTGIPALLPNASNECIDLLTSLLIYDPDIRITSREALKHSFFREYNEAAEAKAARPSSLKQPNQEQKELSHTNSNYIKKEKVVNSEQTAVVESTAEKPPKQAEKAKEVQHDHEEAKKGKHPHAHAQHHVQQNHVNTNPEKPEIDNSDSHSIVSTTSTSTANNSAYYAKVKQQDDRFPVGMGNTRVRRMKKKEYTKSLKARCCETPLVARDCGLFLFTQKTRMEQKIEDLVSTLRKNYDAGFTREKEFRIKQLYAMYDLITKEEAALANALKLDLHKSTTQSIMMELGIVANGIVDMVERLDDYTAHEYPATNPAVFLADTAQVRRQPHGVVLIIGAWNYPVQLALLPLVGAIGGGNAAVVKVSEISVNTSALLAKLIPKYLDTKAVQVVEGAIPESTALLKQKFDFICYTGNTNVGRIVMQAAAKNLTPVLLELGGKCPVIVDDTVDPKIAATRVAWGKTINAGQTCIAPDYVMVHKKVAKDFVKHYKDAVANLFAGDPSKSDHFCHIVSENHFNRLNQLVKDQLKVSGTVEELGGVWNKDTLYVPPTILTGVGKDPKTNPIMSQELFGPIIPIIEVDSVDEAIDLVNKFGPTPLSVHPFSKNRKTIEKVIAKVNAGHVMANDCLMNAAIEDLPFGGVGQSGMGSYHGKHSYYAFTRPQAVLIRDISHDLGNLVRYPQISGNQNSIIFKLVKSLLFHKLRPLWVIKINNSIRKVIVSRITLSLAVFAVGYFVGNRK
ncbi:Aldehyde dehydrogenase [Boothiomyces sp. JEL0866]|nr:Aldehyde dehydrogenase [Boothiomyces sp. JEL0866]